MPGTWAEGLPGTFGGAVYGNAGCYGGDMAQSVTHVDVWRDGAMHTYQAAQLDFTYRSSAIKRQNVPAMHTGMPVADLGAIVVGAIIEQGLAALESERLTLVLERAAKAAAITCSRVGAQPPKRSEL